MNKNGAKSDNLDKATTFLSDFKPSKTKFTDIEVFIPEYFSIDSSVYLKFLRGIDISNELEELFYSKEINYIRSGKYILRSSALYSEDNGITTGAGIYTSYKIHKNIVYIGSEDGQIDKVETESELIAFQSAIISIYDSVNSDSAKKYREINNIENEEMGIIVQKYKASSYSKYLGDVSFIQGKGYANSIERNLPGIMKLTNKEIAHTFNKEIYNREKDNLEFEIIKSETLSSPADFSNFDKIANIGIIELLLFLEKKFNKPIQIEYTYTFTKYFIGKKKNDLKINLLQVRPLPNFFLEQKKIDFPNYNSYFEGNGIGIGSFSGNILSIEDDNSQNIGILLVKDSYRFSIDYTSSVLPKEGAVIVLGEQDIFHSHIETLCAERENIICCYNKLTLSKDKLKAIPNEHNNNSEIEILYNKLINLEKLRVVSNGNKAKVYNIDTYDNNI